MFRAMQRGKELSVIPEYLQLFEPTDIKRMFLYLEQTFHISKEWQKKFNTDLLAVARGMSDQEFFFRFLCEHLDPPLRILLKRPENVVFAIARYLIKDRIDEKKREQNYLRNFYRNGEWKKNV
jgi:pantothenate kinase-related protein Tda10